ISYQRTGTSSPPTRPGAAPARSAEVDELQRDPEVLALEQGDGGLQIVALLARDPQLVALDLRLDPLGARVAHGLGDLLRVLRADPLDQGAGDLVLLAGLARLARVEGLQRDLTPGQLLLEHL